MQDRGRVPFNQGTNSSLGPPKISTPESILWKQTNTRVQWCANSYSVQTQAWSFKAVFHPSRVFLRVGREQIFALKYNTFGYNPKVPWGLEPFPWAHGPWFGHEQWLGPRRCRTQQSHCLHRDENLAFQAASGLVTRFPRDVAFFG